MMARWFDCLIVVRFLQVFQQYLKLKKSSRLGKFSLLAIKTYQVLKTLQVRKITYSRPIYSNIESPTLLKELDAADLKVAEKGRLKPVEKSGQVMLPVSRLNYLNFVFFCYFLLPIISYAHEIRPAYLEIKQTNEATYQVLWKIPLLGNKAPKIDPILPDNFTLTQIDDEFLPDAYIRRYEGAYALALNGQKIAIKGLELTLVDVLVQINLLDESSYTLLLQPDKAEAIIPKEPNKWEVIQLYILLGIEHILIGIDHLLFVLGLLLLVKGIKPLIQTITAFTVAHSITLGAATFNLFNVPQAPVEAVIALSIVFLAREYISVKEGQESLTAKHPWIVAFTFGLLHGFGFAGALSEIGFPQKEVPLALFTFNVGVELGQLIFIAAAMLLMKIIQSIKIELPSWAWRVLPYSMGILAAFWLVERVVAFW